MKFLEAHRIVRGHRGGRPQRLFLGTSGTADPLEVFLRAAGAKRGLDLDPSFAPFGTLRQSLLAGHSREADEGLAERFILFPWDVLPDLDWRTGFPAGHPVDKDLREEAHRFIELLGPDRLARSYFVDAPIPPIHPDPRNTAALGRTLVGWMAEGGARIWDPDRFALSSYLASGAPFASAALGSIAGEVVSGIEGSARAPRKVLITDLDGVLWRGVIGEDGPGGVECSPEGRGYPHFLYQTYLRKLRNEGVLVAAVSRNDPELVESGFRESGLTLKREDLVAVLASYGAKSAQIRQLAETLNLGLDSFVFVDDNPIELAEVGNALPDVACVPFPESPDALIPFFDGLAAHFARDRLTGEDRARTELYRRRLEGMAPSDLAGADLTSFLTGLGMRLEIHDRTRGNRDRAVQLINKTNQFNLNGVRRSDEEVLRILKEGGELYSASLADRTGEHGEILSCLLDAEGRIRSWVLSCRVFQRRVEHRFLAWLADRRGAPGPLEFALTARNQPIRDFLTSLHVELPDPGGWIHLPEAAPAAADAAAAGLFRVEAHAST